MGDDIYLSPLTRAGKIARYVAQAAFMLQMADDLRTPWERLLVAYSADLRARRLGTNADLLDLCVSHGIETEDDALAALEKAGLTPSAAAMLLAQAGGG